MSEEYPIIIRDRETRARISWWLDEFPDGQVRFKIAKNKIDNRPIDVAASVSNPLVYEILRQAVDTLYPQHLLINYLYGSRSDKDEEGGYLTSNVASQFRNWLQGIDQSMAITLLDPHSKLFENPSSRWRIWRPDILFEQYDALVFPDESAFRRRQGTYPSAFPFFLFAKERKDGGEMRLMVKTYPSLPPRPRLLVVDDICDGGRTFEEVYKRLESMTTKSDLGSNPFFVPDIAGPIGRVDLFVTHAVFSGGAPYNLLDLGYDTIYTTNSLPQAYKVHSPRISVRDVWN